ncbi:ADP-ribosylglycohydrolase family protein [Tepidibacillus fermentans]|uniref:ADP-ribosyl-[dinitrogen reductase] hydrolase n=1 Tax=Tepidibacillus fermentans TaxID=1281767 RepID=A0A4R3KEH4_9BACI|nr:ADP-ribosylglycohydrolase family protein [Tepidibacillus fermentans]TCS81041.1 ADP-ribosyl-[dinitrogen reductase] hydrolase [Tepidibacillus fermentans]
MLDKIKGALFGVAVGDALGGTTEFMTPEQIQQKYGRLTEIVGGGVWNLEPGETTDDTAMTIAVAKGIIANSKDPVPAIGEEFMKWFQTNPKDVGRTVSLALEQYIETNDWELAVSKAHELGNGRSAGNGTLMRTLPVALSYQDLLTIEKITESQSRLTHYDFLASEASVIYNRIAHRILTSEMDLKQAIQNDIKGTRYESVLKGKPNVPPNGYVVHTFLWVLHLLLQYSTVEEVIIEAANMGGDSDTIAAISGGLMGLDKGYESIPKRFTEKLLLKRELNDLANQLYKIRIEY